LTEVHVARYLEEHHVWPDGVPIVDEHGELTRTCPRNVHHQSHYNSAENDANSALEAPEEQASKLVINIEGPVIIGAKSESSYDLSVLLRQALL